MKALIHTVTGLMTFENDAHDKFQLRRYAWRGDCTFMYARWQIMMERRWTTEILTFSLRFRYGCLYQGLTTDVWDVQAYSSSGLKSLSRCFTSFELKKQATASKSISEESSLPCPAQDTNVDLRG